MLNISKYLRQHARIILATNIENKVFEFLKENPNPSDDQVHDFAEKEEIDISALEKIFYRLATKYVNLISNKKKKTSSNTKGFSVDIEKDTIDNKNFREVLYTGPYLQLVLMSLKPGEDIGSEVHGVDQFFRFEAGTGEVIINGNKNPVSDGISVIVPAGAKHNVKNTGKEDLKMYTIYSPPHHKEGIIHKTKNEAVKDEEEFEGKTTEG